MSSSRPSYANDGRDGASSTFNKKKKEFKLKSHLFAEKSTDKYNATTTEQQTEHLLPTEATASVVAATSTQQRENCKTNEANKEAMQCSEQCKNVSPKYQYIRPQMHPLPAQTQKRTSPETTSEQEQQLHAIDIEHSLSSDDHTLVYYEGNLISGSLQALIEHMVPTSDYYPDRAFMFAFLLSSRLFIRTYELLGRISDIWEQQQSSVDVTDEVNLRNLTIGGVSVSPFTLRKTEAESHSTPLTTLPIDAITKPTLKSQRSATQKSAQNCVRLLSDWIEMFPYDFRDERLMQKVRLLARKCVYIDNSLGKQVSRILQLLVQRLTNLEKYEEFLQSFANYEQNHVAQVQQHLATTAIPGGSSITSTHKPFSNAHTSDTQLKQTKGFLSAMNAAAPCNSINFVAQLSEQNMQAVFGIMDICASCSQLAHQLTAIELERLSHIGLEEFVQTFAKEYQHFIPCETKALTQNDTKKTHNLESYVEWFNRLSYLTASEIVKYPKKKQRVCIIEFWIETARECFNIGNFNSLMAIIAGLNLASVSRLKKTWSKVHSAKFSVLEHQMDPTANFNSYRSTLKAAMWRSEGATNERERIIIPFFSLFVKDLYYLNELCSNRLPNNHINFEKCSQLAKQVMEFNEWRNVSCPFEKLPNVINYLQSIPVLTENTLSVASFECEPPENNEEKGFYKTVKAETKQILLQQLQEQQQQQQ